MKLSVFSSLLIFTGVALGATSCTTFDDLKADPALAGEGSSGRGGGNGTCANPPCLIAPDGTVLGGGKGAECKVGGDCASTICEESKCTEPLSTDSVRNGTETDIDCGGTAPTNAPKCLEGKTCKGDEDCHWGKCAGGTCGGDVKGAQDGDQTDIDCGGVQSPPCDWSQKCLFDRDCGVGGTCGADKKCLIGPSCNVTHGGTTCGTGEFGQAGATHESCCKSNLVEGFTDAKHAGKLVYLDKYEITAGRMRAFLESLAKQNAGAPNVQGYMATHRPARWEPKWEPFLPSDYINGETSYTITTPTADLALPGNDINQGAVKTQPGWNINNGTYTIGTGVNYQLGSPHYFPEWSANGGEPDYAATHNLNCTNTAGSYGMSTYWFDAATVQTYSGGVGKAFPKEVMDEKSLNCTPFALFAAFCAWDGGELMTAEVFDHVAGAPWAPGPSGPLTQVPPRLTGGNQICGGNNSLVTTTDGGADTCLSVYNFPVAGGDITHDGSNRIAAPGRVPADTVTVGGSTWHDLKGNLVEAVMLSNNTFDWRGYGLGFASMVHHKVQGSTPRMKGGSYGARCMRFRDKPAPN